MTKAQAANAMRAVGLEEVNYFGDGAEILFRCHEHKARTGHADRKPSASLNFEKELWRCRSCGARGTMKKLLGGAFIPTPLARDAAITRRNGEQKKKVTLPAGFKPLDEPNNYLKLRSVDAETICDWGIGIAGDYIVAPALVDNRLVGWVGRAIIPGLQPRCDMPLGVNDFILGYNQACGRSGIFTVVVEGMFDAFKVWRAGYSVVAVLGQASAARRGFIYSLGRNLILFPDTDEGGDAMVKSLMSLATSRKVQVARCPDGRGDPADCTVKEIRSAVETATRKGVTK